MVSACLQPVDLQGKVIPHNSNGSMTATAKQLIFHHPATIDTALLRSSQGFRHWKQFDGPWRALRIKMDPATATTSNIEAHDSALAHSDDDFKYEEVEVLSEEDDDISEDLDLALHKLQVFSTKDASIRPASQPSASPASTSGRQPELVDDFIRNFMLKNGMERTLETFETEWYERKATGKLAAASQGVPDIYSHNAELQAEVVHLRQELAAAQQLAGAASGTWEQLRKERDFHRLHHKRVAQEKNRLLADLKRLKDHYAKYEPTILELKRKYESALRDKMLLSLDRDRSRDKVNQLETQLGLGSTGEGEASKTGSTQGKSSTAGDKGATRKAGSLLPAAPRQNPYEGTDFEAAPVQGYSLQATVKAHSMSLSALVLHPTKPILVTASDDKSWKMWHLPAGDLIMCGEGHKDWVAGVDFHPGGTSLASASGDSTVKIWDFEQQKCVLTLTDHKQAVWAARWHDLGEVLASASLDHSVRLWDVAAGKCRHALRGHVDSVNDCCWQPFSNVLCTASSDKTVSLWDARSQLCTHTLYGHHNSCNTAVFNLAGSTIASTDADGVVKLWDVRMAAEIVTIRGPPCPANKCSFDASGKVLAVASDDGKVRLYAAKTGEQVSELVGHKDAVQAAAFDPAAQFMVTCGSDNTFRLWA